MAESQKSNGSDADHVKDFTESKSSPMSTAKAKICRIFGRDNSKLFGGRARTFSFFTSNVMLKFIYSCLLCSDLIYRMLAF